MPNINEFLNEPEKIFAPELEKMGGVKPCSKCDKNAEEYFWDAVNMIILWECPDGHKNSYSVG
jgi:hypothetical protein